MKTFRLQWTERTRWVGWVEAESAEDALRILQEDDEVFDCYEEDGGIATVEVLEKGTDKVLLTWKADY